IVAKSVGYPGAIAVLDGARTARAFLVRFVDQGVPAVWHAGSVVRVTVHGVDPTDAASCRQLATVPRGRWLWATTSDPALIDAATTPPPRGAPSAGTDRTAQRRERRA